jgi:hypothetical protein
MQAEDTLPTEAHTARLRRDQAIRRALEAVKGRGPKAWEVWVTLASSGLGFGAFVYATTRDPLVALGAGAGVAALNLSIAIHTVVRRQHAALVALIEVVQENETRRA